MDQRLTVLTLGVTDLTRSREFYSVGLRWTPLLDLEDVVFYQVGAGLVLALFPLDALGADAGVTATLGTPVSLGQNVAQAGQVAEALEKARAAGGTVLKEAQRAPFGGFHGYFADPDGHRWEIAYNPGWSVDVDGTVRLVQIGETS